MLLFLIDENLPRSVGNIFSRSGFSIEFVHGIPNLRGKSDEAVFNYATSKKAIIVTRDLHFTNPLQFDLKKIPGLLILRFPSEITVEFLCQEIERLTRDLQEEDFARLIVIEPGFLRSRALII